MVNDVKGYNVYGKMAIGLFCLVLCAIAELTNLTSKLSCMAGWSWGVPFTD